MWFQDVLRNAPLHPTPVELSGDDTAVLMYTGGTTGVSKGAELTHRNIFVNPYMCKVWLNVNDVKESGLVQLPLFHSFGMTIAMNLPVLVAATMVLIPDPRDIKDVVESIHKYRPTGYPGVPAIYNAIIHFPNIEKYDLSSIRFCVCGASPLPREVHEKFQQISGANLVEGYGLSETSPVTHANPMSKANKLGTIGLPLIFVYSFTIR